MKRRVLFSLPLLAVPTTDARAGTNYELFGVILLQPQELFQARLDSAESLSNYIKAIGIAADDFAARHDWLPPSTGFIVLAIRPNRQSRVWLDFDQPLPEASARDLTSTLSMVPPPAVTGGTVALAIKVGMWGGPASSRSTPAPAEWRAAAERAGRPLEVTQLIDSIWH